MNEESLRPQSTSSFVSKLYSIYFFGLHYINLLVNFLIFKSTMWIPPSTLRIPIAQSVRYKLFYVTKRFVPPHSWKGRCQNAPITISGVIFTMRQREGQEEAKTKAANQWHITHTPKAKAGADQVTSTWTFFLWMDGGFFEARFACQPPKPCLLKC